MSFVATLRDTPARSKLRTAVLRKPVASRLPILPGPRHHITHRKKGTSCLGYKIYYQGITHSDLRSIDVGNVTTYTVTGLYPDTYGFCVTAYDTSGNETGGSNIVSTTLSPPMYGFRDASALSQRGDDSLAGLYSRSLSENHRCSRSAQKDLL